MRSDFLKAYSESLAGKAYQRYYARIAEEFLIWLGERAPDAEMARAYRKHLQKRYSDGTVLHRWNVLARLYKVNKIPWEFTRGEAPIIRELEEEAPILAGEDIKAMIDVVVGRTPAIEVLPREEHRAYLCLATVWGMREAEMASMVPEYLQSYQRSSGGMAGTIFVETAKSGRQRYHLVPDFIMPILTAWGFNQPRSMNQLSRLNIELRKMIGFTGETARDYGWRSIRRSAIKEAWAAGFGEPDVYSFYRWKRSRKNMPLRYATGRVGGRAGVRQEVGGGDRDLDLAFYKRHPFVQYWKQELQIPLLGLQEGEQDLGLATKLAATAL